MIIKINISWSGNEKEETECEEKITIRIIITIIVETGASVEVENAFPSFAAPPFPLPPFFYPLPFKASYPILQFIILLNKVIGNF